MDEFFITQDAPQPNPQPHHDQAVVFDYAEHTQPTYEAPQQQEYAFEVNNVPLGQGSFEGGQAEENDFNEFQEDETTKRIRQEEERIQNTLREKSEREWNDKQTRKEEGKRQLQQYLARKEQEKVQRAADNLAKEAINKEELAKLNVEANWRKVISNINVRAGEHKGKKDTSRMREAILHRREDDKR